MGHRHASLDEDRIEDILPYVKRGAMSINSLHYICKRNRCQEYNAIFLVGVIYEHMFRIWKVLEFQSNDMQSDSVLQELNHMNNTFLDLEICCNQSSIDYNKSANSKGHNF